MRISKWLLLVLGCLQALRGQSANDLNSLILQAERFASAEMAAQGDPEPLALYLVEGTRGPDSGEPMTEAVAVQHWRLTYRLLTPERTAPHHGGVVQRSLQVTCEAGVFRELLWLTYPVMDYKELARVWVTLPLGDAIRKLKDSNFRGGFTRVTLMRTRNPQYPDSCTYAFHCPADRATVGISAQTGELLWSDRWEAAP